MINLFFVGEPLPGRRERQLPGRALGQAGQAAGSHLGRLLKAAPTLCFFEKDVLFINFYRFKLSPSIHKFDNEFIYSGLSAE
jgi:hypothetical protein